MVDQIPKLEPMAEFFNRRVDGYEEHQKSAVDGAPELYSVTASLLPVWPGCRVLDLGCGTGLELDEYFPLNPTAEVVGIDLAADMLAVLEKKHGAKKLTLVRASYFEYDFGTGVYDAAVSVMSLHHFTKEQKLPLYEKLRAALREDAPFVLTDYFAPDDAFEAQRFAELEERKILSGIKDGGSYHFDTPLTAAHETEALLAAGFTEVKPVRQWGNTVTLLAR